MGGDGACVFFIFFRNDVPRFDVWWGEVGDCLLIGLIVCLYDRLLARLFVCCFVW